MPELDAAKLRRFLVREGLDADGSPLPEAVGDRSARMRLRLIFNASGTRPISPGSATSATSARTIGDAPDGAPPGRRLRATAFDDELPPEAALADALAHARLLEVGKTLAFGEIVPFSENDDRPVAHRRSTYAIPPSGAGVS